MNPDWRRMQLVKLREEYEDVCRLERESKARNDNLLDQISQLEEQNISFALNNEKLKQIKNHYKEYVMKIWPVMRDSYYVQRQLGDKNELQHERNKSELLVNQITSQPASTLTEYETFSSANSGGIAKIPHPQTSTPVNNGRAVKESVLDRTVTKDELMSSAKGPIVELFPKLSKPLERKPQLSTVFQPVLTCPPGLSNSQDEQQRHQKVKIAADSNRTSDQSTAHTSVQNKEAMLSEARSELRNGPTELHSIVKDDVFDAKDSNTIFKESSIEIVNNAYEKLIQNETKSTMQPEEEISESDDDVENEMMAVMSSINPIENNDDNEADKVDFQKQTQQLVSSNEDTTKELVDTKKIEAPTLPSKLDNKSKPPAFRFDLDSDSDVGVPPLETDKNSDRDDFSFFD